MLLQQTIFEKLFSGRRATVFCLLLALLNKSLIAWLHSDLEADKALYLLLTKSFLETGLMSEPVTIIETGLGAQVYNPAIHSPLYVLIAAPFLWITKSYFVTQLLVSVTGWIIFLGGLYKVAMIFCKQRWIVNVFILFAGFFLYPHELATPPKDTLAVGFVLWAIYFAYTFLQSPTWRATILLSVAVSCVFLIKLLYIPVGLVLVVLLFFLILRKDKPYFIQYTFFLSLLLFYGAAIYLSVFLPVYNLADQQMISLVNDGTRFSRGVFPQNLLHTYPFISSSIINTNFWGVQIEKASGIFFGSVMDFFRGIDAFGFIVALGVILRNRRTTWKRKADLLLIMLSLSMIAAVAFLSLTYEAFSYKSAAGVFTFVMEARVFLLPIITIQLFLFRFIFSSKRYVVLRRILLLLFVFECFHGVYFTVKKTLGSKQTFEARTINSPIKKVSALLKERKDFTLVTADNALRRYALINGSKAYAISSLPLNFFAVARGHYLIASHAEDSALLRKFGPSQLKSFDTIPPFIMHTFVRH